MKLYGQLTIIFLMVMGLQCLSLRQENNSDIITIALMGTNDLHGTAFPKQLHRKDNQESYTYGGLVYMARLINIIKEQYGSRAIYLDTGDQYQGGIQAGPQASKGEIIADFFNSLDLKASALGNHQFDYGHDFLINYLNAKNSSSLAANLYNEQGEPNFLPKHKSSQIFQVNGVKLGVIGLATTETPRTTSGFISNKFPQYQFHQYPEITIKQADRLRESGAEIVVVLAHFGNKCPWNKTYDIRTNETEQEPCEADEVLQFIDKLPEGTIDGLLCGHRHQFAHHWHRNIPFMGAIDGGYYFNVMYFNFDTKLRKVVSTAIQGPIPVCEKIFENTRTCEFHTNQELRTAGPLTSWVFHEKPVHADQKVSKIFQEKYIPQMQKFTKKLVDNELLLGRVKDQQNSLANFITRVMVMAAEQYNSPVDFSVINHGAFRSTWYPGAILDQHFYNMFPFENHLATFVIKGSDLKQMISRVQNGWDGFYFMDGIFQHLSITKVADPHDPHDFYYQKGYINATLLNGSEIKDDVFYKGVSVQFLLEGGDDFVKAFGKYINPSTNQPYEKLPIYNVTRIGEQRQLIHEQMEKIKIIQQKEWRVDPHKPRIVITYF